MTLKTKAVRIPTLLAACLLLPGGLMAQPAADTTKNGFWNDLKYSGLVDAYYSLGFNHPASQVNALRNFDAKANAVDLNYARVSLEKSAKPIGFRIDAGLGRATKLIHGAEEAGEAFRYIQQIYVSLAPPKTGGLQFDFGKFNTSAGAEVTETHLNWNYSRSLLFANGPYYHFGLRATKPITKWFTAGAQLVNGWNNIKDNNGGKTVGLTAAFTGSKVSWFNNYYVGPEKARGLDGNRHFYDTVLNITARKDLAVLFNFDYGVDQAPRSRSARFYGFAAATKYSFARKFAVSPRVEWYNDRDAFITGAKQQLKEFTLTGEYMVRKGVLTRLEYRRDWSNQPFFERGANAGVWKNQDTVLLGIVAYFDPRS